MRQPPRRRVDELRELLQQLLPLRWKGVGGEPEWTAGALVAGVSRVQAEVQTCSLSSSAPLSISSARRAAACSGVSGGATGDGGAAAVAADCAQARALGRASVVWVVASAVSTCTKRGDARNGATVRVFEDVGHLVPQASSCGFCEDLGPPRLVLAKIQPPRDRA